MNLPLEHYQEERHREILKTLPFQRTYAPYTLVQDAKACLPLFGKLRPSACRKKLDVLFPSGKHFLLHPLPRTTLLVEPPPSPNPNRRLTPAVLLEFDALPEFPLDILPKPGLTLVAFLGIPEMRDKRPLVPQAPPTNPYRFDIAQKESAIALACLEQPAPHDLGGFLRLAFEISTLDFTP